MILPVKNKNESWHLWNTKTNTAVPYSDDQLDSVDAFQLIRDFTEQQIQFVTVYLGSYDDYEVWSYLHESSNQHYIAILDKEQYMFLYPLGQEHTLTLAMLVRFIAASRVEKEWRKEQEQLVLTQWYNAASEVQTQDQEDSTDSEVLLRVSNLPEETTVEAQSE